MTDSELKFELLQQIINKKNNIKYNPPVKKKKKLQKRKKRKVRMINVPKLDDSPYFYLKKK